MTVRTDLTSVIAASARWLLTAYPTPGGALSRALAEAQARQAAAIAADLLYPTRLDVQLLHLLGPSGSHRLERFTGEDLHAPDDPWRTWVDETVVSWAACLLADQSLALVATTALSTTEHHVDAGSFQRLANPGTRDIDATPLLRHPDLLESLAGLHRAQLIQTLNSP
jgi:hypothetical protein